MRQDLTTRPLPAEVGPLSPQPKRRRQDASSETPAGPPSFPSPSSPSPPSAKPPTQQSSPAPLGRLSVLFSSRVSRKLSGCLSAAVLRQASQTLRPDDATEEEARAYQHSEDYVEPPTPAEVEEHERNEARRPSLQLLPLAHRLSLRLVSRAFGELLHARRVHTLVITKRCRYDHCRFPHDNVPKKAERWRKVLPGVRCLRLEHLFVEDMAALLATKRPYPSLRRLTLDGSYLFPEELVSLSAADYPSLQALKWKDARLDDETSYHEPIATLLGQLLSSLPEPDALRHLRVELQRDLSERDGTLLWSALERFRRLRSFSGLRSEAKDQLALLKLSAETLVALDALNCEPGDGSRWDLSKVRRLGLLDRAYNGVFRWDRATCEAAFGDGVESLLLRLEIGWSSFSPLPPMPCSAWAAFAAFPRLRVLHLAVDNLVGRGPVHWAFYAAVEGLENLRVLGLSLPDASNEVRLRRVALETLALDVANYSASVVALALGGVTERSLQRLHRAAGVDVLWGEDKVPVEQAPPVIEGKLEILEKGFNYDPFDF